MLHRIMNAARKGMNIRILRTPVWVWSLVVIGTLLMRDTVMVFLTYAAAIGITLSGITLMVGGRHARRWAGRLFAYSVALAILAGLLAR